MHFKISIGLKVWKSWLKFDYNKASVYSLFSRIWFNLPCGTSPSPLKALFLSLYQRMTEEFSGPLWKHYALFYWAFYSPVQHHSPMQCSNISKPYGSSHWLEPLDMWKWCQGYKYQLSWNQPESLYTISPGSVVFTLSPT